MKSLHYVLMIACAVWALACCTAADPPKDRVYQDDKGRIRTTPLPVDAALRNTWTPELEDAFWDRAQHAIAFHKGKGYGNLYFENEKRAYPIAMLDFLAGNRANALRMLQADDNEPWSGQTLKVDFFPSFTLKGQCRKYFFFGEFLDPAYKQRMRDAANIWTAEDPLRRKNPFFKGDGPGWTPENKNSWVDTRNTDNLRAMREVSAYLFAEEAGNEAVRLIYKERLARYVWALYNIGMGEWDSNNYHGHTLTAYINLYDFAKDPEVQGLGKAAMDWLCATGAAKYWRGGFGGPSKRDYGGKGPWGSNVTHELGMYFGGSPLEDPSPAPDDVHIITSAYRPPMAVMGLAAKAFARPTEVLATHPTYENWKPGGEDAPAFFETQFFGNTYQLGTLTDGSQGDVNGFNLLAYNTKRGIDHFVACSGPGIGTKGISTGSAGGDNVAQYRNLVIWLSGKGDAPFRFMVPKSAARVDEGGVTFLQYEKTWLALRPINLAIGEVDKASTDSVAKEWPDDQIMGAQGTGGTVAGFALEIGEAETHGDFDAFRKAVLAKGKLDLTQVAEGTVAYTGVDGGAVKLTHAGGARPPIWRNGVARDYANEYAEYQPVGGKAPIALGWKQGTLRVEAGGYVFTGTLKDGKYTSSEVKAGG